MTELFGHRRPIAYDICMTNEISSIYPERGNIPLNAFQIPHLRFYSYFKNSAKKSFMLSNCARAPYNRNRVIKVGKIT